MNGIHEVTGSIPVWSITPSPWRASAAAAEPLDHVHIDVAVRFVVEKEDPARRNGRTALGDVGVAVARMTEYCALSRSDLDRPATRRRPSPL